ncbi:MAG: alkaline phosphatase family protein [Candidatus Saliniplasma sp.]
MKLAVIGLDGAAFELIDPWIKEGVLPNMKKVKEKGVWGDQLSVLPPVTSPNWKAFATGKNPGKLGIFWWENIDFEKKKVYYPKERKFQHKEIWDHLDEHGYKVGVLGMPTTYPPHEVNGFFVSSGPDAADTGFTYPKELEKRLKNRYNMKIRPDVFIRSNPDRAAEEIHKIIEGQFDAGLTLAKEYDVDFLQLTIFHINVLQHFFWNDDKTKKGWEIIDEKVGEILDTADNVLFMSDHGCNKIEHVFNINTWLEKEGYLKTKRSFGDILKALHIDRELLAKISDRLHLQKFLRKVLPPSLIEGIPTDSGEVKKEGKTSKVDWENSQVFASGQGPIYFNKNNIKDTEKLKKEIINKLENLRHPETNNKIVDKVFRKEEIYEGEYLDEAPDLVMDQARGIHIAGGLGKEGVFQFSEKWKAENKKYGIFAAVGEDVERSGEIEGVSILDLAPTIIDYFGIKIPKDIDGKSLDIFSTKLTLDKKKTSSEETKKIEDALKDISI